MVNEMPKAEAYNKHASAVPRWFIFLGLSSAISGARSLKNVGAVIPQAASIGDTITLQCRYDLEGEPLYTLKWYKGSREFFRYIPKEHPSTQVFPYQDIDVDLTKSNRNSIVLRNLQPEHTGTYKCEVSSDAPNFYTKWVSSYMYVVDVPRMKPELQLEKERLQIGYTLRANCSSPLSYPPMNITWFLNERVIPISFTKHVSSYTELVIAMEGIILNVPSIIPSTPAPSLLSSGTINRNRNRTPLITVSGIEIELDTGTFQAGRAKLRCESTLFHLYRMHVDAVLFEERPHPRPSSVLGSWDGSGGSQKRSNVSLINVATLALLSVVAVR